MKKLAFLGMLSLITGAASAATLTLPPITVLGTDVFSGPSYTVPTNYAATDILSLSVSGIVYLQPNNTFGTNAAGVVVVPGSSGTGATLVNGSTNFGSLLLSNGSTTVQVFPANVANGLGSGAPPTTLNFNGTIGSLFGTGLSSGTVLQLRVSDTNTGDNSGSFSINASSTAPIPEPSTWVGAVSGLALLFAARRLRTP